jgi:hypothetical protein
MDSQAETAINMTAAELLPYVTLRETKASDEQVYSLVYHVTTSSAENTVILNRARV